MFVKKLNIFFLIFTILASIFLVFNWYQIYLFNNNPLSNEIKHKIKQKEIYLKKLIKKNYKINVNIPIIISEEMPSNLFGMAVSNKKDKIAIYLNKKRFKESIDYMINDVLPHEYAHALMFKFNNFSNKNGGHDLQWENICKKLEGQKCNRFVDRNDVLIEKTNFLYTR